MSNLRHLKLNSNDFTGNKIPELIGNLTILRYLDHSNAVLGGEIPHHQLGNLTSSIINSLLPLLSGCRKTSIGSLAFFKLSGPDLGRSKTSDWLETIDKLSNLRNLTSMGM
ncbi:putative leucine-rich repeat domain, L domain-containing protein [Rosa chinensis]|uniref:Putative leucine-rich repeat domain, L domain-containing protein n=1 Tax=Rosa chinensis TaxID=74649 RepID=A0A2P6SH64_ROSCH|nr:putative leucine-rich repeat domain, L domain-containing protein [Rosa chinensis]